MRLYAVLVSLILLLGCEATPVKNVGDIKTKVKLNNDIKLPVASQVAYYVDKTRPGSNQINFYGTMEEALHLVLGEMFSGAEKLKNNTKFQYFYEVSTISEWDFVWGGYKSTLKFNIKDSSGNLLFSKSTESSASGTGGFYDVHAVFNDFAKNIKETTTEFFNKNKARIIDSETVDSTNRIADIRTLLPNLKHSSSGTGFFINEEGIALTAAHVVNECVYATLNHAGREYDLTTIATSDLLDLAAVKVDATPEVVPALNKEQKYTLGSQLFVTGFPLSDLLSEYPSLTVGNLTSKGGLKGSTGTFQFSAPIQPGNSGGAIVDYKGNLLGLVSASLNQVMMLSNSGTTAQNINFGIDISLITAFLERNEITFNSKTTDYTFEKSSADATNYTNQILCYR